MVLSNTSAHIKNCSATLPIYQFLPFFLVFTYTIFFIKLNNRIFKRVNCFGVYHWLWQPVPVINRTGKERKVIIIWSSFWEFICLVMAMSRNSWRLFDIFIFVNCYQTMMDFIKHSKSLFCSPFLQGFPFQFWNHISYTCESIMSI